MADRYVCNEAFDPLLGENIQVKDTQTGRVVTIYTGPYALPRAKQRAAELEAGMRSVNDAGAL